eukprot:14353478-Alexandrium_andersonii.AAC.1
MLQARLPPLLRRGHTSCKNPEDAQCHRLGRSGQFQLIGSVSGPRTDCQPPLNCAGLQNLTARVGGRLRRAA